MTEKAKGNAHGLKTKAGMLLSKFLKDIAQEQTEFVKDDDNPNEDRMVTKAEALSRLIWKKALGYDETLRKTDKDGCVKDVKIYHAPDKVMIGLIFDRMEGRAPLLASDKDGRIPVADRISNEGKNRVNSVIKDREK